jgi:hypothetical protein
MTYQRLLNEATMHGVGEILRQMPVEYTPELEQAIHDGVRQAVLHYAEGMDTLARQLYPLGQRGKARA